MCVGTAGMLYAWSVSGALAIDNKPKKQGDLSGDYILYFCLAQLDILNDMGNEFGKTCLLVADALGDSPEPKPKGK
jgi:hypothetical protein